MEVGRPPYYKSIEELEDAIEEYFLGLVEDEKKATITGLAYHLGFESRQSFYDYEQKGEFAYTIKRSRLRVEMSYEERLGEGAGPIFALKNFGWKDKTEVEQSGGLTINWNEEKTYSTK